MSDDKKTQALSEAEAANVLGLARRTLANHRYQRTGPPYRRFTRGKPRICYTLAEIEKWRRTGTKPEK